MMKLRRDEVDALVVNKPEVVKVKPQKKENKKKEVPSDLSQLDIRVGKIVEIWNHADSHKLYCGKIDIG